MQIPPWVWVHTTDIKSFEGNSGSGPVYGITENVRCLKEYTQKVLALDGDDGNRTLVSPTTVYYPSGTLVKTEDVITLDGVDKTIMKVAYHDGGTLPTPDHVEVNLSA